jgi:hypothetical protein
LGFENEELTGRTLKSRSIGFGLTVVEQKNSFQIPPKKWHSEEI